MTFKDFLVKLQKHIHQLYSLNKQFKIYPIYKKIAYIYLDLKSIHFAMYRTHLQPLASTSANHRHPILLVFRLEELFL